MRSWVDKAAMTGLAVVVIIISFFCIYTITYGEDLTVEDVQTLYDMGYDAGYNAGVLDMLEQMMGSGDGEEQDDEEETDSNLEDDSWEEMYPERESENLDTPL
jgi:hypothetical protein